MDAVSSSISCRSAGRRTVSMNEELVPILENHLAE